MKLVSILAILLISTISGVIYPLSGVDLYFQDLNNIEEFNLFASGLEVKFNSVTGEFSCPQYPADTFVLGRYIGLSTDVIEIPFKENSRKLKIFKKQFPQEFWDNFKKALYEFQEKITGKRRSRNVRRKRRASKY
jgi:hypothetical protein